MIQGDYQKRSVYHNYIEIQFEDQIKEFDWLMTEKLFKYTKIVLEIDENYTDDKIKWLKGIIKESFLSFYNF